MSIHFTDMYAKNENFGITFQAKVKGKNICCVISIEALDDIDPSNRFDEALEKFRNNRAHFECIARKKILNGETVNGKVCIDSIDVL